MNEELASWHAKMFVKHKIGGSTYRINVQQAVMWEL